MPADFGRFERLAHSILNVSTLKRYPKMSNPPFINLIVSALTEQAQRSQLIPVFQSKIGNITANVCDARTLHAFLDVGKDFSSWLKGRIDKYKFQEGQDFMQVVDSSAPQNGGALKSNSYGDVKIDYHLSLDMAKELSMVENNEKGRQARKYFIDCERKALEAIGQHVPVSHTDTLLPSEQQTLTEVVHAKVANLSSDTKGKALAEIWSRIHHKFRVAKYDQLERTQLTEAMLYIWQMQLHTHVTEEQAKPDLFTTDLPQAPEYLNEKFLEGVRRMVFMIAKNFSNDGSARNASWKALRKAVRVPFPEKFTVEHIPAMAVEFGRQLSAVSTYKTTLSKCENQLIKAIFNTSGDFDLTLDQTSEKLLRIAQDEYSGVRRTLKFWEQRMLEDFSAGKLDTHGLVASES